MKNSNIEWTDLPDYVRRYLDGIDVDAMGKDAADKLLASIDAVATQRATLEQQIYELTTSDAQKLIDTRAKEREAIDASNSTMLDRLYALQDERAATAAAAQAAQEKARIEEQIANQRSNLQTQLCQLTGNPRQRTSEKYWEEPLDWNADHEAFFAEHGRRQRVFCASLADVFDNEVPGLWRQHLMSLVAKTPNLDWLFLTKRIGNARKMLTEACMHDGLLLTADDQYRPPANLWIGATITSQAEADRDIPKLLATPAAKRFLSMEPLLGPVSLRWASAWPENAEVTGLPREGD